MMAAIHPLLYGVLLAIAVGLGLPAGVLVVGAGALFGPGLGLLAVLAGEAAGLVANWWLCRRVLRPRMQRWLQRRGKGRWLHTLLQQAAGLPVLVMLRLTLVPMNMVNAGCALGPTRLRPYGLACLALVPRFALMVWAGSVGAEASRGSLTPLALAARCVALVCTAAVLVLLGRGLHRALQFGSGE